MVKAKQKDKFLKLEFLRKKYGFTQHQMAMILGVKTATYSNKINRRAPLTYDEMEIIMATLNKKAEKCGDPLLKIEDVFLN